ncbi:hypothetical protein [Nannocystis sp.]|uniref:hypothetical protein n=1 Tax=Nannocystis sp. TaxID=1962667 RepID=UPI0024289C2C|nr:hypothetical protein [Nannocystis sp.]MBK7827419.1 hypothetical protein [Nannocystis sp.]MBK9756303.1 hypothetical protein [Nannocystis sp.]
MRPPLFCAVLFVAACNPDDERQGSATGFTTTVTTATTVSTAASSGDGSSGDASSAAFTSDAPTTSAGATTELASTGGASTTAVASSTSEAVGSTSLASTTADTGAPLCPPQGEQDCSPGPGSGEGDTCAKGETCFRVSVQDAVKQVLAGHPEWFMHDDMGDYVVEVELYMNAVVELVAATGLCAIRDPNAGDEIAVKFNNEFAESFDILTAAGYARYGDGIYTATCTPAWF